MTIRINQIAVDFTLEHEKTFAELTASLRAWAHGQDLAVLGILADGKALGPDDPRPLTELAEIEVEAVPAGERDLARVAVVARYFSLLAQAWERRDESVIATLAEEFPSVREAATGLLAAVEPRIRAAFAVLDSPWNDAEAGWRAAQSLALEAEGIRRELQNPWAALTETLDALDSSLVGLEAVPGLFQKGRDRDGLDLILHLFTVFEDLGRRAALVRRRLGGDDAAWARFHAELQPLLEESAEALAAGDTVLLTDLLEYELTPRLKTVRSLFPETGNLDRVPGLL